MPRKLDLRPGQKIGTFTILESLPSKSGHAMWRGICTCGREREMRSTHFQTVVCTCQSGKPANTVEQLQSEIKHLRSEYLGEMCTMLHLFERIASALPTTSFAGPNNEYPEYESGTALAQALRKRRYHMLGEHQKSLGLPPLNA